MVKETPTDMDLIIMDLEERIAKNRIYEPIGNKAGAYNAVLLNSVLNELKEVNSKLSSLLDQMED